MVSGSLEYSGNQLGGRIQGKSSVHDLSLNIDELINIPQKPLEIVFKDEAPPSNMNNYPLLFDVSLDLLQPATATGQNLFTSWKGAAHLGGSPLHIQLKGDLQLVEGEYKLNGRSIPI